MAEAAAPRRLDRLGPVLDRYDGLLLDIWGVLHDGRAAYPAAAAALQALKAAGKRIVLLSNTPATADVITRQLIGYGLPVGLLDGIVTSGDAVRAALLDPPGRRYALLCGDEGDYAILPDLERVEIVAADFILANCLLSADPRRDDAWRARLEPAAARGLPMLVTNPDVIVMGGTAVYYCAGAVAELYQSLGGPVQAFGKPHTPVYQRALALLAVDPARVLAVGDTPETDILGARRHGLASLLVAGGILAPRVLMGGRIDMAALDAALLAHGAVPDYVAPYLDV